MLRDLEQHEQSIERELRHLPRLPAVPVRRAVLERTRAAVRDEARRAERWSRRLARWRAAVSVGLAAAAVLVLAVVGRPTAVDATGVAEAELALLTWERAWSQSSDELVDALGPGYTSVGDRKNGSDDLELWIESLEQTLDHLGAL